MEKIVSAWRMASEAFGCAIIQQTVLSQAVPIFGDNEHRVPGSPLRLVRTLNERIRAEAEARDADVLALDERIYVDGLRAWHDPMLWHRAKMESGLGGACLWRVGVANPCGAGGQIGEVSRA